MLLLIEFFVAGIIIALCTLVLPLKNISSKRYALFLSIEMGIIQGIILTKYPDQVYNIIEIIFIPFILFIQIQDVIGKSSCAFLSLTVSLLIGVGVVWAIREVFVEKYIEEN